MPKRLIAKTRPGLFFTRQRTTSRHAVPPRLSDDTAFRIVTYNVHKCRGLDGRVRPERIVEVLTEVDADIIALQEVFSGNGHPEVDQARFIAGRLGFKFAFGENRRIDGSAYGNALLTRLPIVMHENYDLSQARREERGCLRADIAVGDEVLHVYNVHLGTAYMERRHQGRKLIQSDILTRADVTGPRILLGDFNEWLPGLSSRLFREHFGSVDLRTHLGRRRTYPGALPLVYLDHIYFDDSLLLQQAVLFRTGRTLLASDHLPLVADFARV